jgi:hypothetical protein
MVPKSPALGLDSVNHPPKKLCFFSNLELVCVFLRRSSGCGSFIQVKMVVDWVNGVTVWVYPYIRNSK